jgi:hypothetical protein
VSITDGKLRHAGDAHAGVADLPTQEIEHLDQAGGAEERTTTLNETLVMTMVSAPDGITNGRTSVTSPTKMTSARLTRSSNVTGRYVVAATRTARTSPRITLLAATRIVRPFGGG